MTQLLSLSGGNQALTAYMTAGAAYVEALLAAPLADAYMKSYGGCMYLSQQEAHLGHASMKDADDGAAWHLSHPE